MLEKALLPLHLSGGIYHSHYGASKFDPLGLGLLHELPLRTLVRRRADTVGDHCDVDDPAELIRKNFRCVMCGKRGATLRMANVEHDSKSYDHLPVERPVGIGGERRTGESYLCGQAMPDDVWIADAALSEILSHRKHEFRMMRIDAIPTHLIRVEFSLPTALMTPQVIVHHLFGDVLSEANR
jgi:hypothetical protein